MKKQILSLVAVSFAVMSMSAQFTIEKNNHIVIGTPYNTGTRVITTDSLASISILGRNAYNYGGYITFGANTNVAVGEYVSGSVPYYLMLRGNNGLVYNDQTKRVFAYSRTTQTPTFDFYCPVKAQGVLLTSDARLKSNVKSLDGEWEKLMDLNPVSYTLSSDAEFGKIDAVGGNLGLDKTAGSMTEAGKVDSKINNRVQYGYVAQELKEVFPDLVMEDEDGYYSVDYIGLIPLLVDAVKNLSAEVASLKQGNEISPVSRKMAAGVEGVDSDSNSLSQNRPNPFDSSTVIDCTVEEGVRDAFIGIYDLQGKQIMHFDIEQRGKTSVTVDGSLLPSGIYIYALVADGKEVATKRMIVNQ